jgi:rhodanese-related sulfurtransferase
MKRVGPNDKFLLIVSAVMIALFAFLNSCTDTENAIVVRDITTADAHKLIQENAENEDFVIVDLRMDHEFKPGHLENAVQMNVYGDTFVEDLVKLDRSKTYMLYCRSGGGSRLISRFMKEFKFNEVYNILGGLKKWHADGLPMIGTLYKEEKEKEKEKKKAS